MRNAVTGRGAAAYGLGLGARRRNLPAFTCALLLSGSMLAGISAWGAAPAWAQSGSDAAATDTAVTQTAGDSDAALEPFQATVGDVQVWFTPAADGTCAVGRANEQRGTDYAVDAAFDGTLELPATVEHDGAVYTVTSVQPFAFSNGSSEGCALTAVSIPATVTQIGQSAFMSCAALTRLDLPADGALAVIDTGAFQRCFALEAVAFPASVEEVRDYAFSYCTSLRSATFAEDTHIRVLGNGAFRCNAKMPGALEEFEYPAVGTIASYVLSFQTQLKSITFLGDSYAYFETEALRGCSSLTSIEIPVLTGAASVLDQPARLQLMCLGQCTSLETVVFKGDADQYIAWSLADEQHPFYQDSAIATVVYAGTPWGGGTGGIVGQNGKTQGSVPASEGSIAVGLIDPTALFSFSTGDVEAFFEVDFFASRADAETPGAEPLATVYLRSDVTPDQVNAGTVEDEQVWGASAADIPQAERAWALTGHASSERLRQGCAAFDAADDDIAGCTVVLEKSAFMEGLEEVAPVYTVTARDGRALAEGVDYTTELFQTVDGVTTVLGPDDVQTAGTYQVIFRGIGAWGGSCTATFTVATVYLGCDMLGTTPAEVAAGISAELYAGSTSGAAVLVNGSDARYIGAALVAARALDAPILLCDADSLGEATTVELRRLGATSVVIVGDQDVVSESVREELAALRSTPSVSRIAVADPLEASVQLWRQFGADGLAAAGLAETGATTAYVVASDDGALVGVAASRAWRAASPVFFAASDGTLSGATRSALKTGGFSRVVVVAPDEVAAASVAQQISNESIAYETVAGGTDALLFADYADAIEDGTASLVFLMPSAATADADPTLPALAGYYCAEAGGVVAPVDDLADADDPALTLLAQHTAEVFSLRFAQADGSFPLDDINRIIAAWGASMDQNGILTNGSEDPGTGSGTRASVYTAGL